MHWLGIDTGGTFTDFVYFDGSRLRVHKVLSTPEAPERAIMQGVADLGLKPAGLTAIHGSTVATNAVLEGKGARTAYITNYGLGDVLAIGRQARREGLAVGFGEQRVVQSATRAKAAARPGRVVLGDRRSSRARRHGA